jgi:hypothetical protein
MRSLAARRLCAALGFLQLLPLAPELLLLHRWPDTWTGLGLIVVGVERQGLRFSSEPHRREQVAGGFMSNPMFAPAGFGVAPTPWRGVQRAHGERGSL